MKALYNSNKNLLQKTCLILIISLVSYLPNTFAGGYILENGTITITLPAPFLGQLEAVNQSISGTIQQETGVMDFRVRVEGFQFVTSYMPDEINETTTQ